MLVNGDESGVKQTFWIEVNTDDASKTTDYKSPNFTGRVLVFDLDNKFTTGKHMG